jgi:hypothetical protein
MAQSDRMGKSPPIRLKGWQLRQHQIMVSVFSLVVLSLMPGCAHKPHANVIASEYPLPAKSKIALIVRAPDNNENLNLPSTGRLAETGRGATTGAALGGYYSGFCGFGAIFCMPVLATVGAVGGAVYGVAAADSESYWKDAETSFQNILVKSRLNERITENIGGYARAHGYEINDFTGGMKTQTEDLIHSLNFTPNEYWGGLEIKDISVSLITKEPYFKPDRQFIIQAHVRLMRAADNVFLIDQIISDDLGTTRPVKEWMEEDARRFRDEIPLATKRLSERIVEELLMKEELPINIFRISVNWEALVTGVEPIFPSPTLHYEVIDSLQPTMRWHKLNRDNVTYDLCIWSAIGSENTQENLGEVVYHRENIENTQHTLETPLEPSTHYFFSVRARFSENGLDKVSDWSRYSTRPSRFQNYMTGGMSALFAPLNGISNSFYQFKTPRKPK